MKHRLCFFIDKHFLQLSVFMLAVIFNVCFDLCSYGDYKDKMYILEQMAAESEESGLNRAAAILRSEDADAAGKADALKRRGYQHSIQNRYYAGFFRQCAAAAVVSAVFVSAIWTAAALWDRRKQKAWNRYFRQLSQCLVKFREGQGADYPVLEGAAVSGETQLEIMRLNEQLEMLEDHIKMAAEQAQEEKEKTKRMVTDISHQLKTPAAALDTCLSVLGEPSLSGAQRQEFYVRCTSEMDGLKALLDSLLQISRLEAGMIRIELKQARLLDTVITAVNRIYPKASEKQIELVFAYAQEIETLKIMQDAAWLCEALLNLLDNAVKYSPDQSEIHISIQRRSSFVRIEIADQGIGIPRQDCHKVFQRFYRGSSRRVAEQTGSGVGLYLVREIIRRHYGNVFVKYKKESGAEYPGSIFVVHLPAAIDTHERRALERIDSF